MQAAADIWQACLVIVSITVIVGLVVDLGRWLLSLPTITAYLRGHMAEFYWPAGLIVLLLLVLYLHLRFGYGS